MHDCALGREGEPSAPRVEHRYYAGDGINCKSGEGGGWWSDKIKTVFIFFYESNIRKNVHKKIIYSCTFNLKLKKKQNLNFCENRSIRIYPLLILINSIYPYLPNHGESDDE